LERQENLLAGHGAPPASGVHFAARGEREARWPRSGREDVRRALAALGAAPGRPDGRERGDWDPERVLAAAWARLRAQPDPLGHLRAALGLASAEPCPFAAGEESPPALAPLPATPVGGIALVRSGASEWLAGCARAVFAELAAGRAVLLIGAPRMPELAQRVVEVLLDAGLPPELVALLHDDGDSAWRAALASGSITHVRASGGEAERSDLEQRLASAPTHAAFGAGVSAEAAPIVPGFTLLRSRLLDVARGEDPELAARRVARQAFGRIETLSGQLHGRVGVARVDARSFSRFGAALLGVLEDGEPEAPVADLEPGLAEHLRRVRALGIDEGATLIHEPQRSRGSPLRLVFTNVDSRMRLARALRPAPLLCLMRAER